jgi:dUTP pyrophosphatase
MSKPILVAIKRFDPSLPLPQYHTAGSVGIDLYARLTTTIPAKTVVRVPLNIALQLPEGTWALLAARSSLYKKGLMMANGIGVGDSDYRGDNDEYQAALFNMTDADVTIEKGERIVQLIIMTYDRVELTEQTTFDAPDRGGFGTTGK